jgi:sec-independent protein translocase protein TatC
LTLIVFGAGFGATLVFRVTIFGWITAPADGLLSPFGGLPVYTTITEGLFTTVKVAVYVGAIVAFPVATIAAYVLARPHLSRKHRRIVALWVPILVLLFLTGVSFAYYVMLPVGVVFLLKFMQGIAVPAIGVGNYTELVIKMVFWLGIIFEIPPAMYLFAKVRLITRDSYRKLHWLVIPSFSAIFGALITPSIDPINMAIVAIPIYMLYRVGLQAAWLAEPGNGSLMFRRMKAVAVWFLHEIAVILSLPTIALIWFAYGTALLLVYLLNAHFSTETPSRSKRQVDSVYRWSMRAVATLMHIRQPPRVGDCYQQTKPGAAERRP